MKYFLASEKDRKQKNGKKHTKTTKNNNKTATPTHFPFPNQMPRMSLPCIAGMAYFLPHHSFLFRLASVSNCLVRLQHHCHLGLINVHRHVCIQIHILRQTARRFNIIIWGVNHHMTPRKRQFRLIQKKGKSTSCTSGMQACRGMGIPSNYPKQKPVRKESGVGWALMRSFGEQNNLSGLLGQHSGYVGLTNPNPNKK